MSIPCVHNAKVDITKNKVNAFIVEMDAWVALSTIIAPNVIQDMHYMMEGAYSAILCTVNVQLAIWINASAVLQNIAK